MLARVFRGYAPEPVDELVRSISAAADEARTEIRELDEQARRLGAELDELDAPERELREIFVVAQREASERRAQTARKADAIRAEARDRAQERVAWLEAESARVNAELARMRGVEDELHGCMRLVLQDALRRLDERAGTPGVAVSEISATRNGTAPAVAIPEPPAAVQEEQTVEMPVVAARIEPPAAPPAADREVEARPQDSRSILYAIAILVAAVGIGVAIWQLRASTPEPTEPTTGQVVTTAAAATATATGGAETAAQTADTVEAPEPVATTVAEPPATTAEAPAPAAPARVALLVRAAGGDSWLSVRAGSANGNLLFEGFLFRGESRRFSARRIWMRVGRGGNLAARLNGKPLRGLPAGTGDVLVTSDGARTLALG